MMMNLSRRDVLKLSSAAAASIALSNRAAAGAPASSPATTTTSIDRRAVVRRHNPTVTKLDPFAALTVGNGEFAFTADVTGLQTFIEPYAKPFPLCTTAQWAWHTSPGPNGLDSQPLQYKNFDTYGRPVPYATDAKGQEPRFSWLRENPHRMHLGRLALCSTGGAPLKLDDLDRIEQTLDLWSGLLVSRFTLAGAPVEVETVCHGTKDMLGVRVRSSRVRNGKLAIELSFAYPLPTRAMVDWSKPNDQHQTTLRRGTESSSLERWIDHSLAVCIPLRWSANATIAETAPNHFVLSTDGEQVELVCQFLAGGNADPPVLSFEEIKLAAASHWERFWTTGGAIDLSGSTHPQAHELERRIVLSQYNTAVHCAGSLPSQETGLLCNSWNGKFHLEMHWWHSAHFVQWGRFPLFERSMRYYEKILPQARELARLQGFKGARWPKMVGPDGKDSPSPVGPLLIWQQPHPIHFAELCYRQHRDRATLERWRAVVEDSADFMASYAHLVDGEAGRYVLGPPMKTVSENADTLATINPTFELAYWRFGLSVAQQWRERLGQPRNAAWDEVLAKLSPLPQQDGLYLMQEGMADTYTKWNWEHPALLMPAAMLSDDFYEPDTMRRTVRKVMETWQWDRAWGWDFGVAAAAAARVGEPELARQALLIVSPKNRYHPNGHNYQRENLTAYLPGNGSLLAAVATMAVTNSFTANDWSAKWEKLS